MGKNSAGTFAVFTASTSGLIPELSRLLSLRIFDHAPPRFKPEEFAGIVYEIGNEPSQAWIYDLAIRFPGTVVLDDADLHEIIRERTKGQPREYLREIAYEIFGRDDERFANPALDFGGQQPRRFTMMRRLLDRSLACVVPDRHTESSVRMKGFRGRVARIPRGAHLRHLDPAPFRARLGIDESRFAAGIFADTWPGVAATILARFPDARIVCKGDLTKADDLDGLLAACDIVISDRPALTVRAFGLGMTVVLPAEGAANEYPADICVPIPVDEFRDEVLLQILEWLLTDRAVLAEIGASAARWISESCAWPRIAREYAGFLAESAGVRSPVHMDAETLRTCLLRWATPGTPNARYLTEHTDRLVRTLQLIPPGGSEDRILEMGCYLQITPALRNLLGYGEIRGSYHGSGGCDRKMAESTEGDFFECAIDLFNCELDRFPYPDGYFSTVLCCELLEHLERDPMFMMSEIGRVLRPGGVLLLTTPNTASLRSVAAILAGRHPGFYNLYPNPGAGIPADSRHQREYTPEEIAALFSAAGFTALHLETGPYGATGEADATAVRALEATGNDTALRGDCIFALGRKEANILDRYPFWLYDFEQTGLE